MLPNRQFHVTVDASSGSVELRHGSITGSPLAVSLPDALLVHRSAFEGSSIPTEWVAVPGEPGTPAPAVVSAALGVDAASYVLSRGLPEDGSAIVASLIDSASNVSHLDVPAREVDGMDGYRIELSADAGPALSGAGDVVAEVWMDRNDAVRRVRVFEQGSDSGGWTLDFTEAARSLDISPDGISQINDVSSLRPAPISACRMG
ncbi:MAG TPA: hypothetical protein VIR30_02525 [Nocardioides sp.]